jgi:hypothetical protein
MLDTFIIWVLRSRKTIWVSHIIMHVIRNKDRQCTYNVLRLPCVTTDSVEKPWVLSIVGNCLWPYLSNMQSACAMSYYLWPVWHYHIFPHYLINSTIFGNKLLNIKCVFWFSLQLLPETFLILGIIQREIIINVPDFFSICPSGSLNIVFTKDLHWLIS